MTREIILHAGVMLLGCFLASVAQVLLKSEAMKEHDSRLKEYLNLRVITGYSLMLLCTMLAIFAYRVIPVSMGAVLDATGYIYVTFFGYMKFKEIITRKRIVALAMIISGIVVYSLLG